MVRLSVFGAGRIGVIHAINAAFHPDIELVSVVDPLADAAAALAKKTGSQVSSIDEVLADSSIQAVIIATSTHTHADLSRRSLDAGKAVFCEKPIDLDLARAKDVATWASQSAKPYMVGFNRRFDPSLATLKKRLPEIGQMEQLLVISRDPAPPPVEYIKVSGGLLRDMTIHDFDIARWLLCEPIVQVHTHAANFVDEAIKNAGDIDTVTIQLTTEKGIQCTILNSRRATYGYDQRVEAFGSLGLLQSRNHLENQIATWSSSGCQTSRLEDFFLNRYKEAYKLELDDFIRAVQGQQNVSAAAEDGVAALALAEVAYQSLESQRPVDCYL